MKGEMKKSALELLTYASDRLRRCHEWHCYRAYRSRMPEMQGIDTAWQRYGAGKILVASGSGGPSPGHHFIPCRNHTAGGVEKEMPETVLFTGSVAGKALAPLVVSAKLKSRHGAGHILHCQKAFEPFTVNKKVFSGKAIATVTDQYTRSGCLSCCPTRSELKENPAVFANQKSLCRQFPNLLPTGQPGHPDRRHHKD
jgi:electron transfer flavoprotein alpha subunit